MSIHRGFTTITASSTQTLSFGAKIYEDICFYVESGTGAGAIKIFLQGPGGTSYAAPSSNRIALAATPAPYRIENVPFQKIMMISSATASTTNILWNAWTPIS